MLVYVFIGLFATIARRLHDLNLSGGWMLCAFLVPLLAWAIFGVSGIRVVDGYDAERAIQERIGDFILIAALIGLGLVPGNAGRNRFDRLPAAAEISGP